MSEETLTETALYGIALQHQGKEIVIDLATKPAEKRHGADWEWWLVLGNKGLGFRVQAKRLFSSGRYHSLFKPGANPYVQLDKLVSSASASDLIPLYCFFNFQHPSGKFSGQKNGCQHSYRGPSFWGCSLALPENVKSAKSNTLATLRSYMYPWHMLVCPDTNSDIIDAATKFMTAQSEHHQKPEVRHLPDYVTRLIELGDSRRQSDHGRPYLDEEYWREDADAPDDLCGLAVFQDLRAPTGHARARHSV